MVQEVVGSNPSTGYWVDIFSHCIVVKNCNVCLKRSKLNDKQAGEGLFKKTIIAITVATAAATTTVATVFFSKKMK